jgi:hypothetical protein
VITLTQVGALIGTVTGVASLGWNIYTKVSAGPKLRVQAWAGMIERPAPPGDPKFLKVIIQNVGSQPTTLTNYGFFQYANKRDRKRRKPKAAAVLNHYQGAQYPYKLAVGDEAQLLMQQDAGFEKMLEQGTVYFWVQHSFAKHPVEVSIVNPKFAKSEKLLKQVMN